MRLFVALPLPEAMVLDVQTVQAGLGLPRVTAPETLHVTLHFLGEVGEHRLADIDEALSSVSSPPVPLALSGADLLPGRGKSALVLLAEPNAALVRLQKSTGTALRRTGIALPRRRFLPHVTIARVHPKRAQEPLQRAALFHHAPATVDRFALFASTLHPDGARHEELRSYPLG